MIDLGRAEAFVAQQQSPETRRAYGRDVRVYYSFLQDLGLPLTVEMTEEQAIQFRDTLVKEYEPNGAARVWTTVRSLYKYARVPNPFEWVKAPKRVSNVVPKVPSDEDVEALVASAADHPQRALIVALLLNGLRASEVADLTWEQIEWHEGATILRVVGKGSKERLVPATIEAERAIHRHAAGGYHDGYVARDVDGSHLTLRQVQHAVYKSAEYAGIEGMHPHALRHHYATRLIRAGVSELHLQRLLGHASVATTQVYVGLNLGDLIAASRRDPRNQTGTVRMEAVA